MALESGQDTVSSLHAFFQSLSLGRASVLVAVVSAVFAVVVLAGIRSAVGRWSSAVLFPFAFSYVVYWCPVWLGGMGSVPEHSAWEFMGVGLPFLAGLLASCLGTFLGSKNANR